MSIIQVNPIDNVAVATAPVKAGEVIDFAGLTITVSSNIAFGHKIALTPIASGSQVIKYGYPIGTATVDIAPGEHVHTFNVQTDLSDKLEYSYFPAPLQVKSEVSDSFMGFKRTDGNVGIRNEIWIIPTVGCVNFIGEAVAKKAQDKIKGSVQGVYSFPHPFGCSQLGKDHENTQKVLSGLIKHPNAGGVLVLGLGCENNSIEEMKAMLGDVDEERIKFLICQDFDDEIDASLALVTELINTACGDKRKTVPVSELVVGLKCGGSDGLSGITANPLAGAFTDKLTSIGGSAILTEVPEMFGAESILMNRAKDEATFKKTVALINDFKDYFTAFDQPIYENPSPGNKDGGITTLEDKALGATQKSGNATVVDVLSYGKTLCKKGLNLLESPGNDIVAVTALAASGAHLILFTTGRGTPLGAPIPVVKISSNSELFARKKAWIDFDAGPIAHGEPLEDVANRLYDYVLDLASGEVCAKTETHGFRDLAIFKTGVTL
ncbi:MAG: altronate dehydratase family protein [Oscillospiraceae bacterium]|nr:altronate dehydratase family protein [Oscillospiraceae bacterium]